MANVKGSVRVLIKAGSRTVASQLVQAPFQYRIQVPAGHYDVTSNQEYVIPQVVTVTAGSAVHADVNPSCK